MGDQSDEVAATSTAKNSRRDSDTAVIIVNDLKSFTVTSSSSGRQVLLPARASEQGHVIGLVSVYIYNIYVIKKKL